MATNPTELSKRFDPNGANGKTKRPRQGHLKRFWISRELEAGNGKLRVYLDAA
jgi:hypothetical protein